MAKKNLSADDCRYEAAVSRSAATFFWRFAALEAVLAGGALAVAEMAPASAAFVSPLLPLSCGLVMGEALWQSWRAKRYAAMALKL